MLTGGVLGLAAGVVVAFCWGVAWVGSCGGASCCSDGCEDAGGAVLGVGVGIGLAGCTVDGASGMFGSCWFVADEAPEFAPLGLVSDWPFDQSIARVRIEQSPTSHKIRRNCFPGLRNVPRVSMRWDARVSRFGASNP